MQKYTLKFILWKSDGPDELGQYPIYLKLSVTLNKQTKRGYLSTTKAVKESEWNKHQWVVNRKDAKSINESLGVKFRAESDRLTELERKGVTITHDMLQPEGIVPFYKYYREVTGSPQLTENNIMRISNYLYGDKVPYKRKRNKEARPLKEPRFSDINIKWLRGFETFLRDVHKYKENSIRTAITDLQAMLNHAEREKIIDRCPIHRNAYRKPPKVEPDFTFLTKEQIFSFFELLDKKASFSRNRYKTLVYFLLGCYTGLRYSDWVRFSPVAHVIPGAKGPNIILRARKNNNLVVMPIGPSLQRIIDIIKEIGPLDIPYSVVDNNLKAIGKLLGIEIIRTHIARHSAATGFANKGLPKEVAAHYLGVSMEVIDIYYHVTNQHIMDRSEILRAV